MKLTEQNGQALVEMAFVLPLLLLILFGIIEFGRALYITNTLTNAAREGARRASVTPSPPLDVAGLESFVESCIPFDKAGLVVDITPVSPAHGVDTIKVAVNLPFHTTVPIMGMLDGITLKGEASMMYE